jgi:hypothetical protein
MFEWLIFVALALPFSDSEQVDLQMEETTLVVSEDTTDVVVNSDESGASPQCCGPNPLPPPSGGQ